MKKIKTNFLRRNKDAHKGDFGHLFVLAGSRGFTGAAYLCTQAALLSGAGLVTLGIPKSSNVIVAKKLVEAMTKPLPETKNGSLDAKAFSEIKRFLAKINVLAIGPGLSQNPTTQRLIRKIIKEVDLPMVIDADGLNALAGHMDILKNRTAPTVITPHPGEMGRLLGMPAVKVQKNRRILAKRLSCMYNIVTVLKGRGTVVVSKAGKVFENTTGNPGMAKGGSGDVLTGILAAFLAQGADPFEAAKLAVYVHGLAGDIAVKAKGQISLLATDIINVLPKAFKKII
ncbi:MAG: NAD(P)H-hydrate dehydratase [PVC group bacterium]|nr:NAD(P)H-hydrate dehydratase [PVC group bacterium]